MDLRMIRRFWLSFALLQGCLSGCGANSTGARPAPAGSGPQAKSPSSKPGAVINSMRWDQTFHNQREADGVLTLAKYEAIKTDMTYEELIALLEIPPGPFRPDDNMKFAGPESEIELIWFGPEKKQSITITLKGKTVVEKSQCGLR